MNTNKSLNSLPLEKYIYKHETRYKMLTLSEPQVAAQLLEEAQGDVIKKWRIYEQMAAMNYAGDGESVKK